MKDYQSVLIIYNPNAMRGKIDEFIPQIKKRLLLRYTTVDAMSSPNKDGAEEIAFKHALKYDIVVSCGGDGTLHNVINGVLKSGANCLIGVLPCGTCNDIAKSLKIPQKLNKALDSILRLNYDKYDVMYDGKNYISYSLATGYLIKSTYMATNESKKVFGRFAYFLSALKCIFKMKVLPLTVKCDDERIHGKFIYFMMINGEYAGGFNLNKNDITNNGKVRLVLIKNKNKIVNLFTFSKLFLFGIKSIRKSKNVIVRDVQVAEIENHSNSPFTVDGEKAKFLKKKIEVFNLINIIKK